MSCGAHLQAPPRVLTNLTAIVMKGNLAICAIYRSNGADSSGQEEFQLSNLSHLEMDIRNPA